jgi:hypothetical protein
VAQIPGFNNIGGILGHPACQADGRVGRLGGAGTLLRLQVGQCYNEVECLARGGRLGGYCPQGWSEALSTVGGGRVQSTPAGNRHLFRHA